MEWNTEQNKPKKRGWLRRFAGKRAYICARRIYWLRASRTYARERREEVLPYKCAEHATPLIRDIAAYDLWLQRNKVTNLRLAVGRINGVIVKPGEILSFWRLVGNPTSRKGYLPGMVLRDGHVVAGTGGGLCQLSNLIYWMTLHTPLTVTERHRHSYDVFPDADRTQPFGSGATVVYNYRDLCIRNTTDHPWQLVLGLTDISLWGEWRSAEPLRERYQVYEAAHWFGRTWWGANLRHNRIARRVYGENGAVIRDEAITENHVLMLYDPYLTEGQAGRGD